MFHAKPGHREALLSKFGPASLLLLIILWAGLLILAYALILWGLQVPIHGFGESTFGSHAYMSAVTFFTLGYGDMTPSNSLGRVIVTLEAGTGFGMLAVVISYLPVLYQSFSRREATALMLDARAGSPPTGGELLRRYSGPDCKGLEDVLAEYERWCASLLEAFLSYPMLAMYRSQHERLSWLACLTAILDASALIQAAFTSDTAEGRSLRRQAQLTFAMGRHLAVDLAYILNIEPRSPKEDRLPAHTWDALIESLWKSRTPLTLGGYPEVCKLREEYEPYLVGLGEGMILEVPPWVPGGASRDSWQTTAWDVTRHF